MLGVPLHVVAGAGMIIGSIPLLGWSLAGSRRSRRTAAMLVDERQAALRENGIRRAFLPALRVIGKRAKRLTPAGWVQRLDRHLRLCGSPRNWTVERVLAIKLILGGTAFLGGLVWTSAAIAPTTIGLAAGAGLVAYALPDAFLHGRGRDRQKTIRRELPDTLDQLTISVEAGLGFDAAINRVATAGDGPLAEELQRLLNEITVGVPRTQAMRHLIDRTDVPELRHFILALQQAEQYGLPVARVLRIQAGELRVKRRQRAEEEAMKIPVKIVFPLVLCIFPALFVVLLGPAVVRVMRALL